MRRHAGSTIALIFGFVIAFTVLTEARPVVEDRTIVGELIDVGCNTKSIKAGGQGTSRRIMQTAATFASAKECRQASRLPMAASIG